MRRLFCLPAVLTALFVSAHLSAHPARADDADPKIDCDNALSTYEMNACADKDFVAADALLNAAYQKALKAVPGLASEKPYDEKSWTDALRISQRTWVAFRDAECKDHIAMFWGGGTGATAQIIGCMTTKTKERTKELQDDYETK